MMSLIGKSVNRVDAFAKVTGEALYPGDINYPDQLYMKILFAGRPHAIVRSIDTTLAKELDQVVAVFTAEDVPMNEYGLILPDQPVLCGPGSSNPYGDRVRFIGDQIALVVAESEAIASKAIKLIDVDYHDLPVISDPIQAMKEGSVKIHPERDSNLLHKYRIRMGDMNAGWAQADVIVEGNYRTPFQEHAYLQPEAGLGYIDEKGRVTVVVGGQWTHEDQEQIAHALDIPQDQVRVIYPAIGGAFGGREDMSVQIVLALATWKLHQRGIDRPVKVIWSREESILGHHKRHPYILHARWGATKAGKLVAVEMDVVADGGAYAYTSTKVLGNATLMCVGPYEVPNVKVDTSVVYTNNIPCGAFRGFGGPQGAFASETQMNKLAEKLRMDPVKIRKINAIRDGSILSVGSPPPKGVTLSKVIEVCADSYDKLRVKSLEESSPIIKRGIGFACAFKNVGFSFGAPEECWATIELRGDAEVEEVILYHAASEVGQGTHTALAQMAAAATNVPMEKVRLEYSDTAITDNSGSVSASRMTFMAGNAIHGAAKIALEQWQSEERPAVGKYRYLPPKTTPLDPETGRSERPNFAYGYVAEAAVVEVDSETGHVHILDLVCVDDVGQVINRQQVVGQIEGAVVQAGGYTILENFVHRDGLVQTPNFSTYLIPGVLDIPDEVHSVILEYADPEGPWGARGMAEMPYLPLAPAVIAAVRDATGVWFDEFPLTPERVLKGLGKI